MRRRYIAWQGQTPRSDLPGSPFASRIEAKQAAKRAGFAAKLITAVRPERDMETIKTTLYIHKLIVPSSWEEEIQIWPRDVSVYEHNQGKLVVIGTHEVEVPIPDVDVTAQAIDALDEEAERAMQEARAKVAELHERIAKLRCLEHKVEGEE